MTRESDEAAEPVIASETVEEPQSREDPNPSRESSPLLQTDSSEFSQIEPESLLPLSLQPERMSTSTENPAPVITPPFRGGIDQTVGDGPVPWTGGNPAIQDREMTSYNCSRPIKHKDLAPIRKEATTGMDSTRHLGMPGATGSSITFATWMRYVTRHLQRCGMDSLFYIPKKDTTTPTYFICSDWGKISMDDVESFLENLDLDKYDRQNLEWSGLFLQESVSLELWTSIEPELGLNVDGLRVLTAIILQYQSSASITVRNLMNQLSDMSLMKTPGENVDTLCNQIFDIASQIEGLGEAPADLASLIVSRFLESSSQAFSSEAMTLYRRTKSITAPLSWTNAIRELKTTYTMLKSEKMWKAVEPPKPDSALSAMQKDIAELKRRGKEDKENPSSGSGTGGNTDGSKKNIFKTTPPPKDGEPNLRIIEGKECSYCGKCKRWIWGPKRHTTEEHRSAAELKAAQPSESTPTASANTASANLSKGTEGETLTMASGFWCQVLPDF
jgi:hypothetical protein